MYVFSKFAVFPKIVRTHDTGFLQDHFNIILPFMCVSLVTTFRGFLVVEFLTFTLCNSI